MIARALRRAPALSIAFVIALLATLWFGGRATMKAVYWADPAHRDQRIAGWMTPGYVARSWSVPPEVIAEALDLPPPGSGQRPPPLEVLAERRDIPLDSLITALAQAIAEHRALQP